MRDGSFLLPTQVFFYVQGNQFLGDMEGKNAFRHLLADPHPLVVGGGESIELTYRVP